MPSTNLRASKAQVESFDSFLIDQISDHKAANADLHAKAAINVGGLLSRVKSALDTATPGIVKVLQVGEFAAPQYKDLIETAIKFVLLGNALANGQPAPAA